MKRLKQLLQQQNTAIQLHESAELELSTEILDELDKVSGGISTEQNEEEDLAVVNFSCSGE